MKSTLSSLRSEPKIVFRVGIFDVFFSFFLLFPHFFFRNSRRTDNRQRVTRPHADCDGARRAVPSALTVKIADPVAVAVLERPHVDLINDLRLPPVRFERVAQTVADVLGRHQQTGAAAAAGQQPRESHGGVHRAQRRRRGALCGTGRKPPGIYTRFGFA